MTYTPDSRLFTQQLEAMRERNGAGHPMWAGIGAYRLDVAGIVEKVTLARRAGAQGVVLFSHESLAPADLRQLGQQVFGARFAFGPERALPAPSRDRDEAGPPPRRLAAARSRRGSGGRHARALPLS